MYIQYMYMYVVYDVWLNETEDTGSEGGKTELDSMIALPFASHRYRVRSREL